MLERREFIDYVVELLGPFGTVQPRRMFGGHGVYLDGVCFAIVVDEALWFKVDEINRAEFEAAGCDRFTYARGGRLASIGFYRAPAEAMDSPGEVMPWARSAYAAALRAHAKRVADERRREAARATVDATANAKAPRGAAKRAGAGKVAGRGAAAKKSTAGPRASGVRDDTKAGTGRRGAVRGTPRKAAKGAPTRRSTRRRTR